MDSTGRVVFLVPYLAQTKLQTFELLTTDELLQFRDDDEGLFVLRDGDRETKKDIQIQRFLITGIALVFMALVSTWAYTTVIPVAGEKWGLGYDSERRFLDGAMLPRN